MKKKTAPTTKKTAAKAKSVSKAAVKKTAVKKAAVKKSPAKAKPVKTTEPAMQQRELLFAVSLIVAAMAIFLFF